ncbi:hypothetical protein QZH41_018223 [Actinostola sp. cb2023]|nr:hypothetical protein QZH41_018223 [Actinostola sp. cb2023]
MSEWVRCNSCCSRPGQRRFYLTNCGHLFCEECMKESPETCKLCKNPCKAIMLTSQMKPEVEEYFIDIPTLLSKQQKKLLQVYEFQRTHWKSFVSLHEKQEASMEKMQRGLQRLVELEREVALLREENNHLRRLLSESKQHHTTGKSTIPSPGIPLRRGHSSTQSPTPYSNSPYGMAVTSTPQQDGHYQQQRGCQVPRTPAGPSRLTVRTPPSNGMIGTTRRSPYHHSQRLGSAGNIPGMIRTANTPGSQEPGTPSMLRAAIPQNNFSPAMNINSPMISSSRYVYQEFKVPHMCHT